MRYLLFFLVFIFANDGSARVTLPKLFGDGMVLQRDVPIKIWGWAEPNEKVIVRFKSQQKTAKAAKDGTWQIILAKEPAGGPYQLIVSGKKNKCQYRRCIVGGYLAMFWPI